MEQVRQRAFTADEFMAWVRMQPTGRYELSNGVVVGQAPERAGHTRTKAETWAALRAAVRAGGVDCEALADGVSVRVDDRTVYEPDTLLRRGPRLPDQALEARDPVAVMEVVSPSSRGIDSGAKLAGYFTLPSLRHYLVADTARRVVVHHRRDEAGAISSRILREGAIALDPPGIAITVEDVFAGL